MVFFGAFIASTLFIAFCVIIWCEIDNRKDNKKKLFVSRTEIEKLSNKGLEEKIDSILHSIKDGIISTAKQGKSSYTYMLKHDDFITSEIVNRLLNSGFVVILDEDVVSLIDMISIKWK